MTHTRKALDDLRGALERLAEELRVTLEQSAVAAQPVALDQAAVGRVSRIDAIQQQQMVEANRREQNARLQRIHAALSRMEADEYGACLDCGEEISLARLRVRPETLLCVDCQGERERR